MPSSINRWSSDVLGPKFSRRSIAVPADDEGPALATIVRTEPPRTDLSKAVLYLHGWSDYFFNAELAERWQEMGYAFFALDLRKYGRSIRSHQTPCYIDDLRKYFVEISSAVEIIRETIGATAPIVFNGHSLGGLIGTLFAEKHPGVFAGLVLNSPWLETQGSVVVRNLATPAIHSLARYAPTATLPNVDLGFSHRIVSASEDGEWEFIDQWRPNPAFPIHAGWLNSVFLGHAKIAAGLHLACPVLLLLAEKTIITPWWDEEMRQADVVIDVDAVAGRAHLLGNSVTLVRIVDGIHDLALSPKPIRDQYYSEIARWLHGYGPANATDSTQDR